MTATRKVFALAVLVVGSVVTAEPASAGGGYCYRGQERGPTEGEGTVVELVKVCMEPSIVRVAAGTEVTFVNRDPMRHNVIGSGIDVAELGQGESAVVRFDDAGTYPFACSLHAAMVGAIVVGDGRRAASAEGLPVNLTGTVGPTSASTTSAAPVPLAASRPSPTESELPTVAAIAALFAVAALAYGAGAWRRHVTTPGSAVKGQ